MLANKKQWTTPSVRTLGDFEQSWNNPKKLAGVRGLVASGREIVIARAGADEIIARLDATLDKIDAALADQPEPANGEADLSLT